MIRPPLQFSTERLLLRSPRVRDAEEIFSSYASDPEVTRYLSFAACTEISQVEEFLRSRVLAWADGQDFMWLLTLPDSGGIIGSIEARIREFRIELGYVLAREYWGQGYLTESFRVVAEWAEQEPTLHRLWAFCDTENEASARLLERVGLEREGVFRSFSVFPALSDKPRDCLIYAKSV